MEEKTLRELGFSRIDHIGIIVRDLDKAVEHYHSLGIGPFEPLKNVVSIEKKFLGKPIDPDSIKSNVRVAKIGSVHLELLQPIRGESIPKKFLETRGEGINHLAFLVNDIEKEEARLAEKGLQVIYSTRFQNGGGSTYFETSKVGGVLFELVQWPHSCQV